MPDELIAVDIDLHRITAVSSLTGVIANKVDPRTQPILTDKHQNARILVEIAGPILHHEESHSYRRWMIYNVSIAAGIAARFSDVLVAPSTSWTNGFKEDYRHAVAGILPTGETKAGHPKYAECHDVRECRAMLFFYTAMPKKWVPLTEYLETL